MHLTVFPVHRVMRVIFSMGLLFVGFLNADPLQAQQPTYNTSFLTDAQLENYQAMTEKEIRSFLAAEGSYFQGPAPDVDGVEFDLAATIVQAAHTYRINPQVLLATLQKESSGVTRATRPSDVTLSSLMGCVASSTAREQVVCAAERFRAYHDALVTRGVTVSGWKVGSSKETQDGVMVTPATRAIAGQFTYTPYAGKQWGGNLSAVGGVYLFYDAWQRFGFDQAPPEAAVASATVFLIDISGSMSEQWRGGVKIESAKQAALDVLAMIQQESQFGESDHRVGVVTFHDDAMVNLPLTNDYQQAGNVIAQLQPRNATNVGAGIEASNQTLSEVIGDTPKIIILLSDGISNRGMLPSEIIAGPVQEAAAAGTCIYTVGFGEQGALDEALLQGIAEGSGCGTYTYADAPSELENIYIRLRHASLGTILGEFKGQIRQDETLTIGQIDVPANQGELYVTLNWPGSNMDLIVTDPSGNQIDSDDTGVAWQKYRNMIYLIISDPRPGAWLLTAVGVDVPEGAMEYVSIASVRERLVLHSNSGAGVLVIGLLVVLMGGAGGLGLALRSRSPNTRESPGLRITNGHEAGVFVPLRGNKLLTIGRSPACQLTLSDPRVSARHAQIERTSQGIVLSDLGSRQGTYVNGQAVKSVLLRGGECVRMGHTEMVFVLDPTSSIAGYSYSQPRGPQAYLSVMVGAHEFGDRRPVTAGTVLGRYPGCPVDLNADALISRQHAWLGYRDGNWYVADMGSGNGLLVNGTSTKSHWLHTGDEVQIGNTRLRFTL